MHFLFKREQDIKTKSTKIIIIICLPLSIYLFVTESINKLFLAVCWYIMDMSMNGKQKQHYTCVIFKRRLSQDGRWMSIEIFCVLCLLNNGD
jgi:hypothetical protein